MPSVNKMKAVKGRPFGPSSARGLKPRADTAPDPRTEPGASSAVIRKISADLLVWYDLNKRPLPWRQTKDPYKIWISEIMLQQTQVDTVIPYYENWMKSFPTLKRLARAPLSRVLKKWAGLGYYARARNLHRTAKMIQKDLKGRFPDSVEGLRKLPGIGRYTAGAIASIAFARAEPILDGNVKRILSRIFFVREPVDTPSGEKKLWKISKDLVLAAGSPRPQNARTPHPYGDFNQAMMELGALICLPENPKCAVCPVQKICKAHLRRRETSFPVKSNRQQTEPLKTVAAIIWKDGKVLLRKQPLKGRWGGLWMFPHWVYNGGMGEAEFLKKKTMEDLEVSVRQFYPRTTLEHGFTKYRVRLNVYEGEMALSGPRQKRTLIEKTEGWVRPKELGRLPMPAPHQKIATHFLKGDNS